MYLERDSGAKQVDLERDTKGCTLVGAGWEYLWNWVHSPNSQSGGTRPHQLVGIGIRFLVARHTLLNVGFWLRGAWGPWPAMERNLVCAPRLIRCLAKGHGQPIKFAPPTCASCPPSSRFICTALVPFAQTSPTQK